MFRKTPQLITTLATTASLLLLSSISPVQAKIECDTSLGTYYPYCINIPDNASQSQKFPTIVFLAGSGARGPPSKVRELSGYDGDGKLVYQYYAGNKGAAQTMAATKFVVVTPILPKYVNGQEQRHYFPEHLDKLYAHLKSKGYPIDWDRLHLGGYSMGGRGVCRNGVAHPELYASLSPAAGPCEAPGSGTLSQQKASSVLDKISAIKHIPLRQYAGKWDNTVGQSSPKQMENALEKCGATNAELIWVDSTHIDMNIKPFTVDRLQWMLKQKRGNSGSNDGKDNNDKKQENKDDDKTKSNDTNLSPIANGKASTDIKQHNTDLKDKTDDDDTTTSPTVDFTSPAPSSSSSGSKTGSCKAKTRQRRKAAKRSLGEEGYAHPGPVRRGILPKPDNELQQNSSSSSRKVKRGLTLADIISNAESLKAKEKRDTQEEEEGVKIGKRTPLESLKAHAGNRRSHSGSSSLDPKLGRRASR